MQVGDRYRVKTSAQPRIDAFFEVNQITKAFDQEGRADLFAVQVPEGDPAKFCQYLLCSSGIC